MQFFDSDGGCLDGRLAFNSELKAHCQRAASIQGRTPTDFVVHSSVEAARHTIREHEYLEMSQRDRLEFVHAVLDPHVPNRLLVQAAKRYRRMRQP